jgi:uncharacterized protein
MGEIFIFIIGILVSAFGTIVGFGGGVFMVPILIIVFQYPIDIAIGSMMSALLPASLIASFFNYRERNIDYLVASLIQFPAVIGTVIGALLVAFLPVLELEFTFAFFVISIGIYMLISSRQNQATRKSGVMYRFSRMPTSFIRKNHAKHLAYRLNAGLIAVFGLLSGTIAGMFGIGGGFMQTPIMIKVFRIPPQIATSTSLFILVITSLTGLATHFWLGHIVWEKSLPLVAAFAIGALGGRMFKAGRPSREGLERMIGIGLFLAGIGIIVNVVLTSDIF